MRTLALIAMALVLSPTGPLHPATAQRTERASARTCTLTVFGKDLRRVRGRRLHGGSAASRMLTHHASSCDGDHESNSARRRSRPDRLQPRSSARWHHD